MTQPRQRTEMELRVAKAFFDHDLKVNASDRPHERLSYGITEYHLGFARAAIRAMREPTAEMIKAVQPEIDWNGRNIPPRDCWEIMITAASPHDC